MFDLLVFTCFCLVIAHTMLRAEATEIRTIVSAQLSQQSTRLPSVLHPVVFASNLILSLLPSPRLYTVSQPSTGDLALATSQPEQASSTLRTPIYVGANDDLLQLLSTAQPGQSYLLTESRYVLEPKKIRLPAFNSSVQAPVTIRSVGEPRAEIILAAREGFVITSPGWHFDHLTIRGMQDPEGIDRAEHAFHLVGNADGFQLTNSQLINFNAPIKSNGAPPFSGPESFPDNVKIINNSIYNEWKRNTKSPVVMIDVVGGDNWVIKDNFIADFGKYGQGGGGVSYGAYLKGNGSNGLIEDNLVACNWRQPYTSHRDVRIGLSLGGGGTGHRFCVGGSCPQEHSSGILRKNRVVNCETDVGIYLNRARDTQLSGNQVLGSLGVDVRFGETTAIFAKNKIEGRIRERDGGKAIILSE